MIAGVTQAWTLMVKMNIFAIKLLIEYNPLPLLIRIREGQDISGFKLLSTSTGTQVENSTLELVR